MQLIPFQGSTRVVNSEWMQVVVLYDAGTGQVVFRQVLTTPVGARPVPRDEAMASARQEAARLGHPVHLLRALVSTDPLHAVGRQCIDLTTGEFLPLPSRPEG